MSFRTIKNCKPNYERHVKRSHFKFEKHLKYLKFFHLKDWFERDTKICLKDQKSSAYHLHYKRVYGEVLLHLAPVINPKNSCLIDSLRVTKVDFEQRLDFKILSLTIIIHNNTTN